MTERALDASVLDTLRGLNREGQPDIVREVLTVFLADAPRRLTAIGEAVGRRDALTVQREAHTLKGAAANIGALAFQNCCRALEELAKASALDQAPRLVRDIHDEFTRVSAEIDAILGRS